MRLPNIRKGPEVDAGPGPLEAEPASVIGRDLAVVGRLDAEGGIRVHGVVDGDVAADVLVVEAEGYLEGTVTAREAHVHGRVIGRIVAPTVVIGATAMIQGTVIHHALSIDTGATVDGRVPWRPLQYFHQEQSQYAGGGRHVYQDRPTF